MAKGYALLDGRWTGIKDLLPDRAGQPEATARDNRLFANEMPCRYCAGIPWHDLPERFGDFRVVNARRSRWSGPGVWQQVFEAVLPDADNEQATVDSTIARAHPHSAEAKGAPGQAGDWAQPRRLGHQDSHFGRCVGQPHSFSPNDRIAPRFGRRRCFAQEHTRTNCHCRQSIRCAGTTGAAPVGLRQRGHDPPRGADKQLCGHDRYLCKEHH
jgi:transposase